MPITWPESDRRRWATLEATVVVAGQQEVREAGRVELQVTRDSAVGFALAVEAHAGVIFQLGGPEVCWNTQASRGGGAGRGSGGGRVELQVRGLATRRSVLRSLSRLTRAGRSTDRALSARGAGTAEDAGLRLVEAGRLETPPALCRDSRAVPREGSARAERERCRRERGQHR